MPPPGEMLCNQPVQRKYPAVYSEASYLQSASDVKLPPCTSPAATSKRRPTSALGRPNLLLMSLNISMSAVACSRLLPPPGPVPDLRKVVARGSLLCGLMSGARSRLLGERLVLPYAALKVAMVELNSDSHSLVGQARYLVNRRPCFG
jgi:hypothetical protein